MCAKMIARAVKLHEGSHDKAAAAWTAGGPIFNFKMM
jgi:hypothetical protein